MNSNVVGTTFVGAIAFMGISGCYFANQPRLENTVRAHIAVGMPLSTAIGNASALRFKCIGANPADCTRLRQSIMPYSCVERFRLFSSGAPAKVDGIEIPKIACAGL